MAVLGNIRKRTGLTIVVIGFAMLAFLVVDAFSGNSSLFGVDPNNLGKVDGTKITMTDYNNYQRAYSNSQGNENQIQKAVWDNIITSKIVQNQAAELGLELPAFQTEAILFGKETPEEAIAFLEELKGKAEAGDAQAAQQYQQYLNFREIGPANILAQQYGNLVASGALTTDLDANWQLDSERNATIEYAFVSYQDLEEKNKVEVSNEEILAYIKKYPKKYKRPGLVDLHYVYFPAEPSAEDDSTAFDYVNQFTQISYAKNKNGEVIDTIPSFANAINDSLYVIDNSIDAPYSNRYFSYQELAANKTLQSFAKNSALGSVKGPYKFQNAFFLSKLLDRKMIDSVNVSHIFIPFVADSISESQPEILSQTKANSLADSLNTVLSNGGNFSSLALQFSKDNQSARNGGVLGWFTKENKQVDFGQEFDDFIFAQPKDKTGVVQSNYGYHLIKILDKKSGEGYKIANIAKQIEVSDETSEAQYNQMNEFFSQVNGKGLNDFVKAAREKDYNYNNADNVERYAPQLGYLGTDQDARILEWAFNQDTEVGSISKDFTTADGGTVVAFLANRYEAGLANPNSVKTEVEPIVKQQKLYDLLSKKSPMSMAQLGKEFGATIANGTIIFGSANLEGKGVEPAVAGAAFGLKQNQSSNLIKGNAGLYIVKTLAKTEAKQLSDLSLTKKQINQQMQAQIQQGLIQSFKNNLEIEDNRSEVFQPSN